MTQKIAVIVGVVAAILIPALQQALGLGISQAAFAAQGDGTLRAAGYAFSIWGLIYLGLAIFAVYQARVRETAALKCIRWPAAIATLACGLWIVVASANVMWATVVIILVAAVAAVTGLLRAAPLATGRDRTFAVVPVALLAGWLTVAAPLNLIAVLTAMGLIPNHAIGLSALAGIAATLLVAAAVTGRSQVWAYPLPTAWGLAAVYVAERVDKPAVAWAAAGAALVLTMAGLVVGLRRARR
jgi:hypothetical protein